MRRPPRTLRVNGRAIYAGRSFFRIVLTLALAACADITGVDSGATRKPIGADIVSRDFSASGVTYYVSPTGHDGNAGTSPTQAWKTLGHVNERIFTAGDRILFQGGATFLGELHFMEQGTAAAPIVVASYGAGRATINAGTGTGITVYNSGGYEIRSINVVGSGRTTNTGSGIVLYTDLAGDVKLPYIRIDSVNASGFGQYGIVIGSWNNATGFSDVRVTYASTYNNAIAGLSSYAQLPYAHQNFYFGHVRAYDNPGVPGLSVNTGSGIVMGGVTGGMIERSVAYNNGWLCNAPEGPVGIWTYDSDGVVIQHNESYRNRTGGPADGGGYDLDQNTRNSIVQYNYSHDNDGPGVLLSHAPNNTNHSGNIVRFNISQNDGRRNSSAGIVVWGRTIGAEIYNNSIYLKRAPVGAAYAISIHNATIPTQDVQNVHIRNNAFFADSGATMMWVSADQLNGAVDLRFEGNSYFSGATAPRFKWGNLTYTGLVTWRNATGQEKLGTLLLGFQVNPGFTAAGGGGTIGNADLLANLTAYKLKPTSALRNKGLNLLQQFGVNVGPIDFYSGSLPFGTAYDIGAHEWR